MKNVKNIAIMLLLLALIAVSFSAYSIFQKQSEQNKLLEDRLAAHEAQNKIDQLDEMYTSELYSAFVSVIACGAEGGEKYATSVDYTRSVDRANEIIGEMYERGYSSDKVRLIVSQTKMKAKQYAVSTMCR